MQWKKDILHLAYTLLSFVIILIGVLYYVSNALVWPSTTMQESISFASFMSLEGVQSISDILVELTKENYALMMFAHGTCFMFLQSTAIPGTIFFNLLGGALFNMTVGWPICLIYNTLGSVVLYLLSRFFGKHLVAHFQQERLDQFKAMMADKNDTFSLFIFMVSIRLFPFTPNWFINVASAQLDIPIPLFAASIFVGLAPYNYLTCKAGMVLKQLSSRSEIISHSTTAQLAVAALLLFALPFLKGKANDTKKKL